MSEIRLPWIQPKTISTQTTLSKLKMGYMVLIQVWIHKPHFQNQNQPYPLFVTSMIADIISNTMCPIDLCILNRIAIMVFINDKTRKYESPQGWEFRV